MNKSLFYVVAVAAIGGFLFGFDSGVISGCEKAIQSEFGLSAFWHGLIISAFPAVAERAGTWAFAFFAAMMAVQLVWAVFFMPETKGGTIEDIERRLGISDK